MKRIALFYIFIILMDNFICREDVCDPVIINPDQYDFKTLSRTVHSTMYQYVNNKKTRIQAFDYRGIDDLFNQYANTMAGLVNEAKVNEQSKFNSDIFFTGIYALINKVQDNDNEDEIISFFKNAEAKANNIPNKELAERIKNDIHSARKEFENNSPYMQKVFNTAIASSVGAGYAKLAQIAMISPKVVLAIFAASVSISIFEKLWNWFWYKDTSVLAAEYSQYSGLINKLYKSMYEYEWVNNNVILTALSTEENCLQNNVKFYFYNGIEYKDVHGNNIEDEVVEKMSMLTCLQRRNSCDDIEMCIDNLKSYTSCSAKKRRREIDICPRFAGDCTLKKERKKYTY